MLKLAIIGSGFGMQALFPAFDGIPGTKIVALCAKPSAALEKIQARYPRLAVYREWEDLLTKEDLDAVAIAVTPVAQYQVAKAALQKGLHVFAEKPLAATSSEAKELLALARKKKLVHGIDFMFPEIAAWKKAKGLIESGALGALRHISVNWDWLSGEVRYGRSTWRGRREEGGGALAFYFSHGLHYLEHFGGPIKKVSGQFSYAPGNSKKGESGFDLLLTFASGATGYAHVSSTAHGLVRHRLEFECERGVIVLEGKNAVVDGFTLTTYSDAGEKRLSVAGDKGRPGEDERTKMVRILAKRFVAAASVNTSTNPSFIEGVRVQELIEGIRAKAIVY